MLTDAGKDALGIAAQRIQGIEQMIAGSLGDGGLVDLRRALVLVNEALAADVAQ
ncbi:hypothetical protein [Nocardia suismassiliense]|uniref:hypothetical protein n=1 Tax=Nocardia suismassiliense TaxID=2077092 RepID=UPI00131F0507|nr:hypothetical protein [Nocardia suismassiliense]